MKKNVFILNLYFIIVILSIFLFILFKYRITYNPIARPSKIQNIVNPVKKISKTEDTKISKKIEECIQDLTNTNKYNINSIEINLMQENFVIIKDIMNSKVSQYQIITIGDNLRKSLKQFSTLLYFSSKKNINNEIDKIFSNRNIETMILKIIYDQFNKDELSTIKEFQENKLIISLNKEMFKTPNLEILTNVYSSIDKEHIQLISNLYNENGSKEHDHKLINKIINTISDSPVILEELNRKKISIDDFSKNMKIKNYKMAELKYIYSMRNFNKEEIREIDNMMRDITIKKHKESFNIFENILIKKSINYFKNTGNK
jgi:hypothetical protein